MISDTWKEFSLDGELEIVEVHPGFPLIKINNAYATATISLYGGQLLSFKPHTQNEAVIWLSEQAVFSENKAIRGGIPICWPWFGAFEQQAFLSQSPELASKIDIKNLPAHGYARISHWEIQSTQVIDDGGTQIVLRLPQENITPPYHLLSSHYNCELELTIIVNQDLKLNLKTVNHSQLTVPLSQALHSYFNISDIHKISLSGLEQAVYIDKLKGGQSCKQSSELTFSAETDSVYIDSANAIKLSDPGFGRTIKVSKTDSLSTIVWNPWQKKTAKMGDMNDNAWLNMVCIEPANVLQNQSRLAPGHYSSLSCTVHIDDT
jgi:D-hexose-6-phosphate mutarotase